MELFIQVFDRNTPDRSKLVPRQKSFVFPMSGKSYKKTVYVNPNKEKPKPKEKKIEAEPSEKEKSNKETPSSKNEKNKLQPVTAPPSKEEISEKTHPKKESSEAPKVKVYGTDIRYRILTDPEYAVEQSLFLQEFQTTSEQMAKATIYKNMVGFNKTDAKFFSQMMEAIYNKSGLNSLMKEMGPDKQKTAMQEIQARMAKYSNQLADIYNDNNKHRNFKTLVDAFATAKGISDAMLNNIDTKSWAEQSLMGNIEAFEASYKKKKSKVKTMTNKQLGEVIEKGKVKGPKQKKASLIKRFDNAKFAAEMQYSLQEIMGNKNPMIHDAQLKTIMAKPEEFSTIQKMMNNKGFAGMIMKEKTELKDYMKGISGELAELLNVYKQLGLNIPTSVKFKGKAKKSITGDYETQKHQEITKKNLRKIESEKSKSHTTEETKEIVPEIETIETKQTSKPSKNIKSIEDLAKEVGVLPSKEFKETDDMIEFNYDNDIPFDTLNNVSLESITDKDKSFVIGTDGKKHNILGILTYFKSKKDNPSAMAIIDPSLKYNSMILIEPDGRIQVNKDKDGNFSIPMNYNSKPNVNDFQSDVKTATFFHMGLDSEVIGSIGKITHGIYGPSEDANFFIGKRVSGDPKDHGSFYSSTVLVKPEVLMKDPQFEKMEYKEAVVKAAEWFNTNKEKISSIYNISKSERDTGGNLVFTKYSSIKAINGIPFSSGATEEVQNHPEGVIGYCKNIPDIDLNEPKTTDEDIQRIGVIISEPDGRIWNRLNYYGTTITHDMPQGFKHSELTAQQVAHQVSYVDTGLGIKLSGHFGDFEGFFGKERWYTATRISGNPTLGDHSQTKIALTKPEDLNGKFSDSITQNVLNEYIKKNQTAPKKSSKKKIIGNEQIKSMYDDYLIGKISEPEILRAIKQFDIAYSQFRNKDIPFTFDKGKSSPFNELNKVAFKSVNEEIKVAGGTTKQAKTIKDVGLSNDVENQSNVDKVSVVVMEPDQRIQMSGYRGMDDENLHTLPQDLPNDGLTPQQLAHSAAYDKLGLKIEIIGKLYAGDDMLGSHVSYLARRISGDPTSVIGKDNSYGISNVRLTPLSDINKSQLPDFAVKSINTLKEMIDNNHPFVNIIKNNLEAPKAVKTEQKENLINNKVIVFNKDGVNNVPQYNGLNFKSLKDKIGESEHDVQNYFYNIMKDVEINEPKMNESGGSVSAGVIVVEPDGKMQIREVANHYAGYEHSFAKGKREDGLSLQQTALKELYEEMGLESSIIGHLGDYAGQTGVTRFYVGKRTGGNPVDAHQETDNVKLVNIEDAPQRMVNGKKEGYLNIKRDKEVADDILKLQNDKNNPISKKLREPLSILKENTETIKPPYHGELASIVHIKDLKIDWASQAGSNKGGIAIDSLGRKQYFKMQKTPDHARNEVLAGKLYNKGKLRCPEIKFVDMGDGKNLGTMSLYDEDLIKYDPKSTKMTRRGRRGFLMDALLANWDVVGLEYDNLRFIDTHSNSGPKYKAVRLDPGGSLLFKAMGGEKGSLFSKTVPELETFLHNDNPTITNRSVKLFGDESPLGKMDIEEILRSNTYTFKNCTKNIMIGCINEAGFSNEIRDKLVDIMSSRHDYISKYVENLEKELHSKNKAIANLFYNENPRKNANGSLSTKEIRKNLTENQKNALNHADKLGEINDADAKKLASEQSTKGVTESDVREISKLVFDNLHLRVDAPVHQYEGKVAKGIAESGILKNQWILQSEGKENGSSTTQSGQKGDTLDNVERIIGGGALQNNEEYKDLERSDFLSLYRAHERPIYGNVVDPGLGHTAYGYGNMSFNLADECKHRASIVICDSFTITDEYLMPKNYVCTAKNNYALVKQILSVYHGDINKIKEAIKNDTIQYRTGGFVEHQVFGGIDIKRDVLGVTIWNHDQSEVERMIKQCNENEIKYEIKEPSGKGSPSYYGSKNLII